MINYIWVVLSLIGIGFAMFNGTMDEVNKAVFQGAPGSWLLYCIGFISVLVFWLGIIRIAAECRVVGQVVANLSPYC